MLVFVHYGDLMQEVSIVTVEGGMVHKPEGVHYLSKTASALPNIVMQKLVENVFTYLEMATYFCKVWDI